MAQNYITEVMNKNTLYKIKDEESRTIIGDLNGLTTSEKADIVSAINEVKESGNEIVAQTEAPEDTNKLWLDTDDNTGKGIAPVDKTLTMEGMAADAKTVGDLINKSADGSILLLGNKKIKFNSNGSVTWESV